jgi:hypothetical protein
MPLEPESRATPPTTANLDAALGLLARHTRVGVPEATCRACLQSWPCDGVRWAHAVLARRPAGRVAV